MMVVLDYFLIAAAAVIAASAIIGFFLSNWLILLLQMIDRSIRPCRDTVPTSSLPHLTDASITRPASMILFKRQMSEKMPSVLNGFLVSARGVLRYWSGCRHGLKTALSIPMFL